jgi:hypothetical protein
VESSCEFGSEPSVSIKCWETIETLTQPQEDPVLHKFMSEALFHMFTEVTAL